MSTSPHRKFPTASLKAIWPALLYLGLTLILTYPVLRHLGTAIAGFDGRDSLQHVWYQWWLKETLLQWGIWPERVFHLYFPLGANHPVLAIHPYVPLVSLPFTLFFDPLSSYNLAFLLGFPLAGLTGYWLAYYLCHHRGAALIGGLIFAFYPNRLGHAAAGHLLLTTNYFLPLYALSLLMLLRRPSFRRAIWHGAVTVLLALAQPTHIGYGAIPIFLILGGHYFGVTIWAAVKKTQARWPVSSALWLAISITMAVSVFLPFAWPTLAQNRQGQLDYLTPADLTDHATDLLAFALPSPYNPILVKFGLTQNFGQNIIDRPRDLEEQLAYIGLAALGLATLALWKKWQTAQPWLWLTIIAGLLSLGPRLKIDSVVSNVALPYTWLTYLPFFAWSRTPGRLNETVMLGIGVLAAMGAAWLLKWQGSKRTAILTALGLGAFIIIEYAVIFPFPTEQRPVSDYYFQLAQSDSRGGILPLPVTGSRRASNYAMFYQTTHQRPLAGGYIERDPLGTVELKEFLNQLASPLPGQTVFNAPSNEARLAILTNLGIEQIIVQPKLMTDRAAKATLTWLPELLGPPLFKDDDTLAWSIPAGGHLPDRQLLPDQENWEVLQDGRVIRLKKEGYLFIYAAQPEQITLNLELAAPADTDLTFLFNDGSPETWPLSGPTAPQLEPVSLRPGFNYFRLTTEPAVDVDFVGISIKIQP